MAGIELGRPVGFRWLPTRPNRFRRDPSGPVGTGCRRRQQPVPTGPDGSRRNLLGRVGNQRNPTGHDGSAEFDSRHLHSPLFTTKAPAIGRGLRRGRGCRRGGGNRAPMPLVKRRGRGRRRRWCRRGAWRTGRRSGGGPGPGRLGCGSCARRVCGRSRRVRWGRTVRRRR